MYMPKLLPDGQLYAMYISSAHLSSQFADQHHVISGVYCQVKVIILGEYIADPSAAEELLRCRTYCSKSITVALPYVAMVRT